MYQHALKPIPELRVQRPAGIGKVFYVWGGGGDDSQEGTDPNFPLNTIATAIGKCSNSKNDYIFVLDHYQETFPISVSVSYVHILGLMSPPAVWLTASGSTSIFSIAADGFEIAGFEFGAGSTSAAIEWGASKGYGTIHDCFFGWMQAGRDGINVTSYEAAGTIIENCWFGSNITRDGIRIAAAMTRGAIRNNIFRRVPGIGINVTVSMSQGQILDNTFSLDDDVNGEAISLIDAGSEGKIMVFGNRAANGMLSNGYAYNPYRDTYANTINDWGLNYQGNRVVEPVGI